MNRVTQNIQTLLFYIFRVFPIQKNKIVINSYMGRGYGGEGKAIADRLLNQDVKYDIVWLCQNTRQAVPIGVRYVGEKSIRSIFELVTAKVWIDNRRKSGCVRKRVNQYYIQTWHGDVCIKHVEKDASAGLSDEYIESAKRDSRMADLFVSGSEWRTNNYRQAFWYDGEILQGDLYKQFFVKESKNSTRENIWNTLGLPKGVHYVLYAPTFRNNHNLDCYSLDYTRLISTLETKYGGHWCVVVRLHPNIAKLHDRISYDNISIFDGSEYGQINDLIENCDLLISDYSGVIFDGFKRKKRVILFATDYQKYTSRERGLYFDFNKMPSAVTQNNDELEQVILNFDDIQYEEERKIFVDQLGYYQEDGADLIAERIKTIAQKGRKI